MTEPLRQSITHLDFTVTCSPPKFLGLDQQECTSPPRWWVEFHLVERCIHPACNDRGNLEYLVCDHHLDELNASACRTVQKLRTPEWLKWFRVDPLDQRCPSCKRLIQSSSDIVQLARRLP